MSWAILHATIHRGEGHALQQRICLATQPRPPHPKDQRIRKLHADPGRPGEPHSASKWHMTGHRSEFQPMQGRAPRQRLRIPESPHGPVTTAPLKAGGGDRTMYPRHAQGGRWISAKTWNPATSVPLRARVSSRIRRAAGRHPAGTYHPNLTHSRLEGSVTNVFCYHRL